MNVNIIFTCLKVNHKLEYVSDYESFKKKDKKTTKCFIEELNKEIESNNHRVIFMLLSLGFNSGKIKTDLDTYWDYCYKYRFDYEEYRDLLIRFPKVYKNKKYEIYKELGDLEFNQGKGHFIDVDCHIKKALVYYKEINAQQEINGCLLKLQKNKKNIEENYPKPIELLIPIGNAHFKLKDDYVENGSSINRVTRTSANNLVYKESSISEMINLQLIKQGIIDNLFNFFIEKEDTSFDVFLDHFELKRAWFSNSEIHELILPALFHFYENYKLDIEKQKANETIATINYVLPLDSLVLKFEGLIRLFLEKKESITIIENKGEVKENIKIFKMLEQFENSLNGDEKGRFKDLDKPYFEHIFGSEELNLRNEIAHSFFKKEYYSFKKVIYIIEAISRIGKYSILNTSLHDCQIL